MDMLSNVLFMLLGATLVSVGVLAAALADRLRGPRVSRERERVSRAPAVIPVVDRASRERTAIPVVGPAELLRPAPAPAKPPRAPRAESRPATATEGGEDVIAALVASGYKRPIATEATWACSAGERSSIEGWTAAALRRACGGLS